MAAPKTLFLVLVTLQVVNAQKSSLSANVNECGLHNNVDGKINNGNVTGRYEHPWLVRVNFIKTLTVRLYKCMWIVMRSNYKII